MPKREGDSVKRLQSVGRSPGGSRSPRQKATLNYLVAQGVKADRISVISYGMERPSCSGHNEECWSQNRRSQFLVKEQ